MSLSCSCDYEPDSPEEIVYLMPYDFSVLETSRRKRCTSCNELIDIGADCAVIPRFRGALDDIEARIYGDDHTVPLAPHYMCEECAGLAFALAELGFCASLYENQRRLVAEYNAMRKAE